MSLRIRFLSVLLFMATMCSAQICTNYVVEEIDFDANPRFVTVESGWYEEWLEYTDGKEVYPAALPPLEKWKHPWMHHDIPSAMHEDSYSTDVTNLEGPIPENPRVQYFQVREKGKEFSGMCPAFAFLDENTMVTLSFGRENTTLLLIDIRDSLKVIDAMPIPGRGHKAAELTSKKARMKLFRNTSGGAYFFLSQNNEVVIPGPGYDIIYVPIVDLKFQRERAINLDILEQIEKGDLVHEGLSEEDGENKLTAVMPDNKGNIWFTSQLGIIGVIDLNDSTRYTPPDCPNVYSTFILKFGLLKKIESFFGRKYEKFEDLEFYKEGWSEREYRNELRRYFQVESDTREEIQNSFAVGEDGVYIVSNIGLYKLRFNEETKEIEMDPKWAKTFQEGDLIYNNDSKVKPGQLNNGSGTTPTLMDDRFVIIGDNDYDQINMCVYSQEDGRVISKHKVFEVDGSACENSIVAYKNSLIIGNTSQFVDPFKDNPTPGGIMRFDFNEQEGIFESVPDWPKYHIDGKSATPKMSTANGLIYVYNRESDPGEDGYHNWHMTAIDYRTGIPVFYIKPDFEKGEFDDNIGFMMKAFSMGKKNYDKKVFNNIWATYTFGPNNSIYIGSYRGFLKFDSDPLPIEKVMKN